MASIEMSAYEDLKREDNIYEEIKKQIKTDHEIIPLWRQWLIFVLSTLTVSLLIVVVVLSVNYFTVVHGTMENIAEDSRKALKLATEIKNMLNGCRRQPRECKEIRNNFSGLQTIYPDGTCNKNVSVQCEEGGWTVIQKRYDGAVEFNRNWNDYENGFGDIQREFWLGNANIAQITSEGNHELRIDVEDWDGNTHYAVYKCFIIGDASTKYRLKISEYSGNAGKYNEF
ncbi:unnamed protein product [Mytilus coruscus]|uniref:Fibrinogen C-terminal domain-containing protein n=1 Tax=Mytilus coruscus TaxID=42192 RepID=A0A6J8C5E5_MYTCO|nr:unnamed protein product [Mytilus coruscus]